MFDRLMARLAMQADNAAAPRVFELILRGLVQLLLRRI